MAGRKSVKTEVAAIGTDASDNTVATVAPVTAKAAAPTPNAPIETVGTVKPPPSVKVPKAPAGFIPPSAADYRGFRPKRQELALVPDAVLELKAFSDYASVFGMTAPQAAHVASALDGASKWSTLLAASTAWMEVVKAGEGMAWKDTLTLTDSLKAPFNLASARDSSMQSKYPALARLLSAAKAIAKKAQATKKRTAKAASTAAAAGSGGNGGAVQPAAPAAPQAAAVGSTPHGITVAVTQ